MMNMPGGMPPQGGMTPPKDAMEANRSVMNPMDMAAMSQKGQVSQDMTVKDLIEKVFKVPMDAPVSALTEAIKRQGMNQNNMGKMKAMAQQPSRQQRPAMGPQNGQGPQSANRMPPGRPSAVPMPKPQQGLADMMR